MAESTLQILINAKTQGDAELKRLRGEFDKLGGTAGDTSVSFKSVAEELTRMGGDLRNVSGTVDNWIDTLAAATPQNAKFAKSANDIREAFLSGKIGAEEAREELEKLRDEMGKPAQKSNLFSIQTFTDLKSAIDLVAGAAQTAYQAVQAMFEFGREGAQVIQTTESFAGLIEKVGASRDLLYELREAAGGTVDDMTLMSSTATLLAGAQGQLSRELANATPELLEIAKAANKLNPTLGDTTFLYDSVATGVKRASKEILDNLGLNVSLGKANEAYAKQLGKTVDQLTDEEKSIALLNETLRQGKVLIEQAGGNTDSAADSIARMEAATKNLADSFKARFAPAVAAVAEALTPLFWNMNEQEATVAATSESYDEYTQRLNETAAKAGMLIDAQGNLRNTMGSLIQTNYILTRAQWETERATDEAADTTENAADITETFGRVSEDFGEKQADVAAQVYATADGMTQLEINTIAAADALARAELDKMVDDLASAQENYNDAVSNFRSGLGQDLSRALQDAGVKGDDLRETYTLIDGIMGTNLGTQYDQERAINDLAQAYADGEIDLQTFRDGMIDIRDEFQPLNDQVQTAWRKLEDLRKKILEFQNIHVSINVDVKGIDPKPGAGSGSGGGHSGGAGDQPRTPSIRTSSFGGVSPDLFVPIGAAAAVNNSMSLGGVTIVVNQQPGQSGTALAQEVSRELGRITAGGWRAGAGFAGN
jgi:hypothetical protein